MNTESENLDDNKLPLLQHLIELRKRLVKSLILISILFIISYKKIRFFSKKNIYLTLIAAVSGGAAMCLYNEGLLRGNVGRTILFFYLTSVWSTMIEVYFLNKPLTSYRGFSITAGFTGLFIMNGIDQGNFLPNSAADFYGIAAGIIWSLGATMLRVNDELNVNVTTALCILFGALWSASRYFMGSPTVVVVHLGSHRFDSYVVYMVPYGLPLGTL